MQRVAEREHHVVRHVDDVRDRPHARRRRAAPSATPARARPHVAEEPADVARAALEVLDRDRPPVSFGPCPRVCPGGRRELAARRARRPRGRCRRSRAGRGGCRSPRPASTSSASGSTSASGVPGSALREHHDPGVVGAELDLVLGEDHPVGELAAHLRAARAAARPGARAPGSATATVAPAPKFQAPQTIWRGSPSPTSTRQSWSRSAFGCFPASSTRPTRKRPRLPSSSGTPRPLDRPRPRRSRSRAGRRAPAAACRRRRSRAARRPGPHQNCLRTRRSPSQSAPDVGEVVLSCATRSMPAAEGEARTTPPGRGRRSRTRAGRPCPSRPSRASPSSWHVRQPSPPQIPQETSGSIEGSVNGK